VLVSPLHLVFVSPLHLVFVSPLHLVFCVTAAPRVCVAAAPRVWLHLVGSSESGSISSAAVKALTRAHNQRIRLIKDGNLPQERGKET